MQPEDLLYALSSAGNTNAMSHSAGQAREQRVNGDGGLKSGEEGAGLLPPFPFLLLSFSLRLVALSTATLPLCCPHLDFTEPALDHCPSLTDLLISIPGLLPAAGIPLLKPFSEGVLVTYKVKPEISPSQGRNPGSRHPVPS